MARHKSMKLGGGGRFQKFESKLRKEGYSKKSAGAIAASKGREKYGRKKMARMSAKGRRRAGRRY